MPVFQPQIIGNGQGGGQIIQYDVMPEATSENFGKVIQYVGDTIPSTEASATAIQTVGSELTDLVVDVKKFVETERPEGEETVEFICTNASGETLNPTTIVEPGLYTIYIDQETFLRQVRDTWYSFDTWNVTNFILEHNGGDDSWIVRLYRGSTEITSAGIDSNLWGITLDNEQARVYTFSWGVDYIDKVITWAKNNIEVNIDDYGISYSGTPNAEDTISVVYTPAISGITKGYFYENQAKKSNPSVTISQTVGTGLTDLEIDVEKFIEIEKPTQDENVDFVCESIASVTPDTYDSEIYFSIADKNKFIQRAKQEVINYGYTGEIDHIDIHIGCYDGNFGNFQVNIFGSDPFYMTDGVYSSNRINEWGFVCDGRSGTVEGWILTNIRIISEETWSRNSEIVNLEDYGITYNGTSEEGDTLTVDYVAPVISGYNWIQKNVQDQQDVGIDWKTKVDVPADYPSQYSWSCAPIYTIPGGLPDGKYEVYWQILCSKPNNNDNIPFGKVTYKSEFGIYTEGNQRRTDGRISYIMDGQWLESGNYTPFSTSYSNILRENGDDLIFFSTNNIFRTDIIANMGTMFVSECFKLSAFKNLDTGEEYIATGELYMGVQPAYNRMLNGYWHTSRLAETPYVPMYKSNNSGSYNNSRQYIRLGPSDCIASSIITCPRVSEFDFSMYTDGGDEYHAIVTNNNNGYSIVKTLKATGVLSNTKIGYNESGNGYVYLNTPNNTSGYVYFTMTLLGADKVDANCYFENPYSNFTPIIEEKVGAEITSDNIGQVLQYIGETTAEYTNGYFYKATGTEVFIPESIECEKHTGEGGNTITINNINGFINTISNYIGWDTDYVKSLLNHKLWRFYQGYDGYVSFYWWDYGSIEGEFAQELYSYMTFDPAVQEDHSVEYYVTYTSEHREYIDTYWEQVNVQPGGTPREPIEPGTHTKISYDSDGLITAGGELNQSDIPVLPLEKISGVVASTAEVNKLHGLNTTTTELNYVNGVTSNIQDQLTNKVIFRNWN